MLATAGNGNEKYVGGLVRGGLSRAGPLCSREIGWGRFPIARRKEKARRKRQAALTRQPLNRGPPAPRDAVLLPLINGLTALAVAAVPPQRHGNGSPAAEFVYEVRVSLHGSPVIRNIFGPVKPDEAVVSFDDAPKAVPYNGDMAKAAEKDPYAIEVGKRLRQARMALDYRVLRAFAENTGTDEDNLGNWERGVSLVPPPYVQRLKELFGITHEWIFGGDASTMRHDLARALLTTDRRK